jgi:hypothetical protein
VLAAGGTLTAQVTAFKEAAREAITAPAEPLDTDRVRASVLRAFVRDREPVGMAPSQRFPDGRLVSIPAVRSKRRIVLEHIVLTFEPGIRYPEREVNAVLRAWHPDHAALRRYLVDEGLLTREDGVYWRSGGPVDLD